MFYKVRPEHDSEDALTVWSGKFSSTFEGFAVPMDDRTGYVVSLTYGGARVEVSTPLLGEDNHREVEANFNNAIDRAIDMANARGLEV